MFNLNLGSLLLRSVSFRKHPKGLVQEKGLDFFCRNLLDLDNFKN